MTAQGKLTSNLHFSGSTIAGAFGVHPFVSPLQAYNQIKDARAGIESEFKGNIRTMIGSELEDTIIERIVPQVVPVTNIRTGYATAFKHLTLPFAVSIDGTAYADKLTVKESEAVRTGGDDIFLDGLGVIECKTTDAYISETCPEHYKIQLFSQMECVPDARWGMVAILKGSMIWIYLFRKEADFGALLEAKVTEFEDRLANDDPPGPLNSMEANDIYPEATEASINLPDEVSNLVAQKLSLESVIKKSKESLDEIDKTLKMRMGEATTGFVGNYRIDWPMRKYKATPEKITPAKPERTIRLSTLKVKEVS